MRSFHIALGPFTAALALALACDSGGGAATTPPADPSCSAAEDIEDGENLDDQVIVQGGRNGYIYTYKDESGTTLDQSGDSFMPGSGGAQGSRGALQISGKLGTGEAYAGVGFSFVDPVGTYDASRYRGITFMAKRGKGDGLAQSVRVKIPDGNTDPKGGVCSECYNDFGIDFAVTEEWTRFTVDFADLKQEDGWGDPKPGTLDTSKLYGIQWQVSAAGQSFDLWIDDVSFIGCDG